jgi:hypothetical protein
VQVYQLSLQPVRTYIVCRMRADPRSGPMPFARTYELALLRAALAESPDAAEAV